MSTYRKQLIDIPLAGWIEFIELQKTGSKVLDADSIQSFLIDLGALYGEVDQKIRKDLTKSVDKRFGLLIHLTKPFGPNSRQFAMA